MTRRRSAALAVVYLVATLLASVPRSASPEAPPAEPSRPRSARFVSDGPLIELLGPTFPIEVNTSTPAALLHWLDSLAALRGPGLTAGKTVNVHREQFSRRFGALDGPDAQRLQDYIDLRADLATRDRGGERSEALTECVFKAPDLDGAIEHCSRMLAGVQRRRFEGAMRHFATRYRTIWNDGLEVRQFLARVVADPRREELARFLVELAGFYGVPVPLNPPPRVLLAPVPPGAGTHAQALGRFLLIEIRRGEGLVHEVPPIAHETAHFLYERIGDARETALRQAAGVYGADGLAVWHLLREALPTALAQGLAGERFQGAHWSLDSSWYHRAEIDSYAKLIFPIVRRATAEGRRLDPQLVGELVRAHPGIARTLTPRSP